jgi:hypothetical protein
LNLLPTTRAVESLHREFLPILIRGVRMKLVRVTANGPYGGAVRAEFGYSIHSKTTQAIRRSSAKGADVAIEFSAPGPR